MAKNSPMATAIKKESMIKALEANFGNVSRAAESVKATPSTHYMWLKEDPEYAQKAENIKDICFRKVKDNLLENALKKIEKGDSAVLNKMLGIFFKKLPDEMARLSRYNDIPLRATIKYVDKPEDFKLPI